MTQPVALLSSSLLEKIEQIIGSDYLLRDEDSLRHYGKDWTTAYDPAPSAIALPRSIEQVRELVLLANKESFAIVPSGGRTGLSGGAVAMHGELVVAMDKMNKITGFNEIDRTVVCEPGVVTEQLQQFAESKGLLYPVDFASSGSSQLGGNIATNAGGIKVIRYGMTRDWVAGLKVVTGKGDLLDLNRGLIKNNAGYDLRQLFIGAEGTLGIIVEATMRLCRMPDNLHVMVLGTSDMPTIMKILKRFQKDIDLTAFEFFSDKALEKVLSNGHLQRPFESAANFYALIEFDVISDSDLELAMSIFEECVGEAWVIDGVLSQNMSQAKNLWRLREDISETISKWTPYKNDISTLVSHVPGFLQDIENLVCNEYPDFEIIWFGHIGDGNVHLNILKPESLSREVFLSRCHKVSQWVFEVVRRYQGSVSAEHGVGLLKKDYLSYCRSDVEIAYMKELKRVFDPNCVLNRGKLL